MRIAFIAKMRVTIQVIIKREGERSLKKLTKYEIYMLMRVILTGGKENFLREHGEYPGISFL